MPDYLLVIFGLAALVLGAEWLVRGGSAIATRLGVSPLLVGLTVVSIGTSLPELAVGIDAARTGAGPLAVGNIAGTNIVNILLILGLSAAMAPLALGRQTIRIDLPMMVLCSLLLWVLAANGLLSRVDGAILLGLAVLYTVVVVRKEIVGRPGRTEVAAEIDTGATAEGAAATAVAAGAGPLWLRIGQLVAGIVVVVFGADWLVTGSVAVAGDLGVSEAVIGLTIVAIGTSAPELVTTVMSTIRGDRDLAIGNLIGSSTYNIAFVLGATSLFEPLEVTPELVHIDIPLMAAVALVCIPVFVTGRRITRAEGIGFVAAYAVYLTLLIVLRA